MSETASATQSDGKEGLAGPNVEVMVGEEAHGELDERERSMIRSILRLDDYNARDVMVPRMDIVSVDVKDNLSDVVNRMLESGHSRLPVYRETIDEVVGVIYSRRLMPLLNTEPPWPPLEELMLEPFFVPETKRLGELLTEFQGRHVQMALVVDEHGGTEGLVTLEDLLEEIVGEIEDEFSPSKSPTAHAHAGRRTDRGRGTFPKRSLPIWRSWWTPDSIRRRWTPSEGWSTASSTRCPSRATRWSTRAFE